MIDFKYHVVSIVAVFLALAVGIVLGTNVLSGDVLKNLKAQTSDLRKEAQDLRTQNQQQQSQLADDQAFAQALEPMAVGGRLGGQRVVVITVPSAPKSVRDQAVKTLTAAGATVTAQVDVANTYDDPQQATVLDELLKSLGTPAFDPTPAGDVPARAAAILASALVGGGPSSSKSQPPSSSHTAAGSPPAAATTTVTAAVASSSKVDQGRPLDPTSTEVLAGLQKAGFLKLDRQPSSFADLAVVVTAAAPAKLATPSPAPDTSLLDLVAALARAGSGTIVVGPVGSADVGGLVAQVRGNESLVKVVSAVDNADTASGRIAMVFALTAQGAGSAGQYGTGQGAQAPLPTAVPAPPAGATPASSVSGP